MLGITHLAEVSKCKAKQDHSLGPLVFKDHKLPTIFQGLRTILNSAMLFSTKSEFLIWVRRDVEGIGIFWCLLCMEPWQWTSH